ncbi:MAG: aldo/keto reductase, partial [Cyclobacteriaceae bacterium]|nr:aldo/keto reductase [Cyclobacteriaceae bacterium]
MKYNILGNSVLKISQISFGCMSLQGEQSKNKKLIQTAYDSGINMFDTADLYDRGENEIMVGEAIKSFRKEVVLSTKVGNVWHKDGSGWYWDASKKHILKGLEDSLKRLKTDYIDYYQLHGGTIDDNIEEVIEAFEQLKEQGKILQYGISSIRPNVIGEYVKKSSISGVMMQYNMLDRRPDEDCLSILKNNNIGVLARGVLAKGLLINKPAMPFLDYSKEQVIDLQTKLQEMHNPLSVSLQFVLQNPAITTAVIGFRTEQQLKRVIEAYDQPIQDIDFNELLEG